MEVPHSRDLRAYRSNLIRSLRQLGTSHFLIFHFYTCEHEIENKKKKNQRSAKG
jgi:hypothetical protein